MSSEASPDSKSSPPVPKKERIPRSKKFDTILNLPRFFSILHRATEKKSRELARMRPELSEFVGRDVIEFDPTKPQEKRMLPGIVVHHDAKNKAHFHKKYDPELIAFHEAQVRAAEEGIARDSAEKPKRVQKSEQRNKEISEAMEAMMVDVAPMIFGSGAEVVMQPTYGDIKQYTDLVVVFRDEERNVEDMLALDITFSWKDAVHVKKAVRGVSGALQGEMQRLNYVRIPTKDFDPEKPTYEYVRTRNVPHVVLPLGLLATLTLLDKWSRNERIAMEYHPKRRALLENLFRQLETRSYASQWKNIQEEKEVTEGQKQREVIHRIMRRMAHELQKMGEGRRHIDFAIASANKHAGGGVHETSVLSQAQEAQKAHESRNRMKATKDLVSDPRVGAARSPEASTPSLSEAAPVGDEEILELGEPLEDKAGGAKEVSATPGMTFDVIAEKIVTGKASLDDARVQQAVRDGVLSIHETTQYDPIAGGGLNIQHPRKVVVLKSRMPGDEIEIVIAKEDVFLNSDEPPATPVYEPLTPLEYWTHDVPQRETQELAALLPVIQELVEVVEQRRVLLEKLAKVKSRKK